VSAGGEPVRVALLEGGRVLDVVIDKPKGNVLDAAVMAALGRVLDAHADDAGLRLVLLRAEGRHFSFGASVEEHQRDQAPAMLRSFHALMRKIAGFPVPTAAVVQGQCLGGAFELALCAHFVFVTPTARFACPEIKLGVFPPVLAAVGAARLGGPVAERLLLTGATVAGDDPSLVGWVTAQVAEATALDEVLAWYREQLAPLSARSLRIATRVAREASGLHAALGAPLERAEAIYVDELLATHDANEGVAAFVERRAPEWTDA
jgi:cyclohexa-1,5-dienecarbonyl-CoA hydratase